MNQLNSENTFKAMALQSDPRIHENKVVEIKNGLQNNNTNSTHIEENIPPVKIEHIDIWLCDRPTNINSDYDVTQDNLLKQEDMDHFEQIKLEKDSCLSLQPHAKSTSGNSSETCHSNYCKDDSIEIIKTKSAYNLVNENLSDTSNETSMEINGYCDESTKVTDSSKLVKQNNKFTEYYKKHYEKQVELFDNPDCQKIISMGLSRKEKDRAKVLCRECGKTVTFRYYVSVHVHTHIGNKPFKCDICGRSFVREYILKQHMHVHADTKEFSCDICGRPFRTLQGAEIHKKTHSDERSFQCHACDKSFKYNETLKQHLLTHRQDKNFMCELCGKSFRNSTGLIRHRLTHNTERTFMCTTCGKGFKSQPLLNYHMKRHSDNKPYVCRYCGTRFKSNNVLKSHVLIHTGAKPFSCKICGKEFRQRPSLRYHMRIHTGETPYECDLCSSKFKYKQHLSNHMKVHRNESS